MDKQMRRLIIIEPYQHQEVLRRWLPLLLDLFAEVECWLSTDDLLKEFPGGIMEHKGFSYQSPSTEQELDEWLKDHISRIQSSDYVLWLTTGLRYDRLLWLPMETHLYVVVHNVQSTLRPRLNWTDITRTFLSLVKYIYTRQFSARRQLLNRLPILLFPTSGLCRLAVMLGYPKNASSVWPFAYPFVPANGKEDSRINIIIPGSIKPRQRDYEALRQIIAKWSLETKRSARLVFLGACKDRTFHMDWTRFAQQLPNLELTVFASTISDAAYDAWMGSADVIVLPLKERVGFGPFQEHMGRTKVSGGVYDALYFCKPLLIPHFYPEENLPESLPYAYYQSVEEGVERLNELLIKPAYADMAINSQKQLKEQMYIAFSSVHTTYGK